MFAMDDAIKVQMHALISSSVIEDITHYNHVVENP